MKWLDPCTGKMQAWRLPRGNSNHLGGEVTEINCGFPIPPFQFSGSHFWEKTWTFAVQGDHPTALADEVPVRPQFEMWPVSAHGFAHPQSSSATTQCQTNPGCLSRHCAFNGLELNCQVLTSELCFPSVWNNTCFLFPDISSSLSTALWTVSLLKWEIRRSGWESFYINMPEQLRHWGHEQRYTIKYLLLHYCMWYEY